MFSIYLFLSSHKLHPSWEKQEPCSNGIFFGNNGETFTDVSWQSVLQQEVAEPHTGFQIKQGLFWQQGGRK